MKKIVFAFIIFCFIQSSFGQTAPLTQTEYSKMIYGVKKGEVTKAEVIEALRKRGIDFVVTDGIRGFTRSNTANDDELKRALDEAGRRKENPVAAKLPSEKEAAEVLENARKKTLDAVEEMPDFVVKQQIQRSAAYAGTNNFRNLDRLVVAVSYRSTGEEDYRLLSMNGIVLNDVKSKQSYEDAGGTNSTGEFVTVLATIFKPESETKFMIVDTDVIRERKSLVFDFLIAKERAHEIISATGISTQTTVAGMKGRIWIDRENARVLRIESEATEIPDTFPVRTARRIIDYDWVKISGDKYLLPSLSEVRLTLRETSKVFETRNLIRFKDYQKYGSEVVILDDDIKPEPTPAPIKP
ncbi:MAG: hypothetical protein ACKVQJ_14690 [Pyrinomonadaceae bacterium]